MKQEIIDELDELAGAYGLELLMPPFNGSMNPFFYIGEIKYKGVEFRDFFVELDQLDVNFRYVEIDGKKDYMEIFV